MDFIIIHWNLIVWARLRTCPKGRSGSNQNRSGGDQGRSGTPIPTVNAYLVLIAQRFCLNKLWLTSVLEPINCFHNQEGAVSKQMEEWWLSNTLIRSAILEWANAVAVTLHSYRVWTHRIFQAIFSYSLGTRLWGSWLLHLLYSGLVPCSAWKCLGVVLII